MPNREPTKEEFEALSKDLTALLIKHNAEIGVKSTIELVIRTEKPTEEETKKAEPIISHFFDEDNGNEGNKTEEDKTD